MNIFSPYFLLVEALESLLIIVSGLLAQFHGVNESFAMQTKKVLKERSTTDSSVQCRAFP